MLPLHLDIRRIGVSSMLDDISKSKVPSMGEDYLGEIMAHKISRVVGVVENVIEAVCAKVPVLESGGRSRNEYMIKLPS